MPLQTIKAAQRGFICVNANHEGCRKNVEAGWTLSAGYSAGQSGRRTVGNRASTGYGLESRSRPLGLRRKKTLGGFSSGRPMGDKTATTATTTQWRMHSLAKKRRLVDTSSTATRFRRQQAPDRRNPSNQMWTVDLVNIRWHRPTHRSGERVCDAQFALKPLDSLTTTAY